MSSSALKSIDETVHLTHLWLNDLHSLFDLGLLAVDSATMTVQLAPRLRNSAYGELHGQRLRPADDPGMQLSREALDQHRRWAGI